MQATAQSWMVVGVVAVCSTLAAIAAVDLLRPVTLFAPPAAATRPVVQTGLPRLITGRPAVLPPSEADVPASPEAVNSADAAALHAEASPALLSFAALSSAVAALTYIIGRYARTPSHTPLLGVEAVAMTATSGEAVSRRTALQGAALAATLAASPALAGIPAGFALHKDPYDGYEFLYPFGWQELEVAGQDALYKDIVEPLETIGVSIIPTDKESITDIGSLEQVCFTFADKFLTSSNQTVTLLGTKADEEEGVAYYSMEFLATAPNYQRHVLATIAICNHKLYTCLTGASERRWPKMKERLQTAIDSFTVRKVVRVAL